MKKENQYHPSKLKPFVQIVATAIKRNPHLMEDHDMLWATIVANVPALGKKDTCPNCGGSMQEYIFEFDLLDALLLFAMAQDVSRRMEVLGRRGEHPTFTEANAVHVQALTGATYATRSRTTQMCSKLGLIAKLRGNNGKQVPGTWVITRRGWAALAGKPVQKSVRVWHGEILDRDEETITITQALKSHVDKIADLEKRRKAVKVDYRDAFEGYDPEEWYHFGELHEGELL